MYLYTCRCVVHRVRVISMPQAIHYTATVLDARCSTLDACPLCAPPVVWTRSAYGWACIMRGVPSLSVPVRFASLVRSFGQLVVSSSRYRGRCRNTKYASPRRHAVDASVSRARQAVWCGARQRPRSRVAPGSWPTRLIRSISHDVQTIRHPCTVYRVAVLCSDGLRFPC